MVNTPTRPQIPAKDGEEQCEKYKCKRAAVKEFYIGEPIINQIKLCKKHSGQFDRIFRNEGAVYFTQDIKAA